MPRLSTADLPLLCPFPRRASLGEVRAVIEDWLTLELFPTASPTGGQLAMLRRLAYDSEQHRNRCRDDFRRADEASITGEDFDPQIRVKDSANIYRRTVAADEKAILRAALEKCFGSLTEDEREGIRARHVPIGVRTYYRVVPDGDLVRREVEGAAVLQTAAGEEFVSYTTELAAVEARGDGAVDALQQAKMQASEKYVLVQGTRPVYPSRSQIAERFGLSEWGIRALLEEAYDKIRQSAVIELYL